MKPGTKCRKFRLIVEDVIIYYLNKIPIALSSTMFPIETLLLFLTLSHLQARKSIDWELDTPFVGWYRADRQVLFVQSAPYSVFSSHSATSLRWFEKTFLVAIAFPWKTGCALDAGAPTDLRCFSRSLPS